MLLPTSVTVPNLFVILAQNFPTNAPLKGFPLEMRDTDWPKETRMTAQKKFDDIFSRLQIYRVRQK